MSCSVNSFIVNPCMAAMLDQLLEAYQWTSVCVMEICELLYFVTVSSWLTDFSWHSIKEHRLQDDSISILQQENKSQCRIDVSFSQHL